MERLFEHLRPIMLEARGKDINEPLDGDDVDALCHILKAKINYHEGNITEAEYQKEIKKVSKRFGE